MKQDIVTIKITTKARKQLRQISALTDEKHYEVIDRLLTKEIEKK